MAIPIKYNLRNLLVRKVSTLMVVSGIALVVIIFISIMAVVDGLTKIYQTSGEPDNLIVLRKGASDAVMSALDPNIVQFVNTIPEVATDEAGQPLISQEMHLSISLPAGPNQPERLMLVRGVDPIAFKVHKRIRIVEGGPPAEGNRIMLGNQVAAQLGNIHVGDRMQFGQATWTVAGIFDAPGTVFGSEIWTNRRDLMLDARREQITDLVMKLKSPEMLSPVAKRLNEEKRIAVTAKSETKYLTAAEASALIEQLSLLGTILAVVMAVGGILGGMNLMYTAVSARTREIGLLQAMGYSRWSVLLSFIIELIIVSLIGGLVGILLALVAASLSLSLTVGGRLVNFSPHITVPTLLEGLLIALLIGVLGGLLPALTAAKLKVVDALRTI